MIPGLHGAAVVGIVLLLLVVLRKCNELLSFQEALMAKIDDAAASTDAKVTSLIGKVDETVVTLGELKVLVGSANTANAEAVLAQIDAKIDTALANLTTAETDADPTPDA